MTVDFLTDSRYEPYLKYTFGITAVVCALISTALNPFIYFRSGKKPTVKQFLFRVISMSDFLTNLLPAGFIAYVILSPTKYDRNMFFQITEFLSCTLGCISQVTATLIAIVRMIQIILPFFSVKFKIVLIYLFCYSLYMILGNAGIILFAEKNEMPKNFDIDVLNMYVCSTMYMLHCFIGIICSLITVFYLWVKIMYQYYNDKETFINDKVTTSLKVRSCNTIMLMNIPYVISIVIHVLALTRNIGMDFSLVKHFMIPVVTSAFNPCVILARTRARRSSLPGRTRTRGYHRILQPKL